MELLFSMATTFIIISITNNNNLLIGAYNIDTTNHVADMTIPQKESLFGYTVALSSAQHSNQG